MDVPRGSLAFKIPQVERLANASHAISVVFDQCQCGRRFSDGAPNDFCKKATKVLGNLPGLEGLARVCPGTSAAHRHIRAWGSFVDQSTGKTRSRTSLAGVYPPGLCSTWAQVAVEGLRQAHLGRRRRELTALVAEVLPTLLC